MKNKIFLALGAALILIGVMAIIGNLPIKLKTPSNVSASYDDKGNMTVNWDIVEKATEYEISDGTSDYTSESNSLVISDVEEGKTYDIKVIAVATRRNKKFYSEPGTYTLQIPVKLGTLSTINTTISGSNYYLSWNPVEGASSYELKLGLDGQVYPLNSGWAKIENMQDGQNLETYIRNVRKVGSHTYYSDWSLFNLPFPAYEYGDLAYEYALDLDLERLKFWAQSRGYKIDIEEKEGLTFADIHYKDSANSGFANGLGRFIGGFLGGYLVGTVEEAEDTYESDFSEIDATIGAFVEAGGVKEYANSKADDFKVAGQVGALYYGLKSLFLDTDVHMIFRYNDITDSALVCELYMLNINHESYYKDRYANCEKAQDNFYHFKTLNNRGIKVFTTVESIGDYNYNVSVIGYE